MSRTPDLGLDTVEQIHSEMLVDEPWTHREARGFTWWASWIRQRIWSGERRLVDGDPTWHVRARTPLFTAIEDDADAYRLVNDLNVMQATSAAIYDPETGTIALACGAFVYDDVKTWVPRFLLGSAGIQASMGGLAGVSEPAAAYQRDDAPHPTAGPRRDPDPLYDAAGEWGRVLRQERRAGLRLVLPARGRAGRGRRHAGAEDRA